MVEDLPTAFEFPLRGTRVLVTRSSDDAGPLIAALQGLGATVVAVPMIRIDPPLHWEPLDRALRFLDRYDWIAFTSRNAVRAVVGRLADLELIPPRFPRVAAIGRATTEELAGCGIEVDVQPERSSARDLATAMLAAGAAGSRVLQPASNRARPELRDRLVAAGAHVDVVEAYRTVADNPTDSLPDLTSIDVVALFSPSTFGSLIERFGLEAVKGVELACIGSTTAQAVRDAGFEPAIVAQEQSVDGLIRAIVERRKGKGIA